MRQRKGYMIFSRLITVFFILGKHHMLLFNQEVLNGQRVGLKYAIMIIFYDLAVNE